MRSASRRDAVDDASGVRAVTAIRTAGGDRRRSLQDPTPFGRLFWPGSPRSPVGSEPRATSSPERATRSLTPSPAMLPPRSRARRSCARAPAPARGPVGAAPARLPAPPCPEAPPGRPPAASHARSGRISEISCSRQTSFTERSLRNPASTISSFCGRPTPVPPSLAHPLPVNTGEGSGAFLGATL